MSYETVHDAAVKYRQLAPVLGPGRTKVYYARPEWKSERIFPKAADYNPADLDKTHLLLGEIASTDREQIWSTLQGEFWSPRGEANELIRRTGLSHTSMDCGDIIVMPDGTMWMCESCGFGQVPTK